MLSAGELLFPRSVNHPETKGRPELIIYSDGSTLAFGSVAYLRWNMIYPDCYHTALLTSCAKVTPKSGMTPPRSELQGLVTAVRIAKKILNHSAIKPCRVTIATDSQCSVAACDMNANALAVFFSNRVVEIITNMDGWGHYDKDITALDELTPEKLFDLEDEDVLVDLIQHTPGELNPADWPTRGNITWDDLGPASTWQLGPGYLHRPRSEWPFSRDFVSEVPAKEKRKKLIVEQKLISCLVICSLTRLDKPVFESSIHAVLLTRIQSIMALRNSFQKCLNIMARAIRFYKHPAIYKDILPSLYKNTLPVQASHSLKAVVEKVQRKDPDIDPTDLKDAEKLFLLASQRDLYEDLEKKDSLDSLAIFTRDGVARMRGRLAPEAMMRTMGQDSLVILSRHSLVPIQKWRHKHRNVEVGDIVLLKCEAALGKPQYRRGRVTEVHPDQHGVVRDATVLTRSRHKGEKLSDFRKKKMTEQRVSVQRLAVLLAADEVANLPKADPALHFCTEDARIPDVSQWSRSPSPSLVPTCPAPPQLVPHSDLAPPGVPSQTSPSATAEKDDEVPRVMEKQAAPADATTGAQHQLAINSLAVSSLSCSPTYLCWECDTRDRVYFVSGEYD